MSWAGAPWVKAGICFCTKATPLSELARAAAIRKNPLLDDLGAEARGGPLEVVGPQLVLGMGADDQKPFRAIASRSDIAPRRPRASPGSGRRESTLARQDSWRRPSSAAPTLKISILAAAGLSAALTRAPAGRSASTKFTPFRPDSPKTLAASSPGLRRRGAKREFLAQKFAGAVVVGEPRDSAGLAIVFGGKVQARNRGSRLRPAQIADRESLDGLRGVRARAAPAAPTPWAKTATGWSGRRPMQTARAHGAAKSKSTLRLPPALR